MRLLRISARLAFAAMVAATTACSTAPVQPSHGSFLSPAWDASSLAVADDAARQFAAVYPPAATRLDLQHPAADAFGRALVEALRSKGYALQEYSAAPQAQAGIASPGAASTGPAAPASDGQPLRYVLDQPGGTDLLRLTLQVGTQTLARAYLPQAGSVKPAGSWSRKE